MLPSTAFLAIGSAAASAQQISGRGIYSNSTTTSPTPTTSGCDVNCVVVLPHPAYFGWGNGALINVVNQTAVTVIVDVSLNVTKTSTYTDVPMIQSYYNGAKEDRVTVGADGQILLSKSGTVVASPTPLIDYGDDYYIIGTYWTTPTGAAPSCVTQKVVQGDGWMPLPSHPAYDLANVPPEVASIDSNQAAIYAFLPGIPQLFSDIPYIAQCDRAMMDGVPFFMTRASFLTTTKTVSGPGAPTQTPVPPPAITPAPSPVVPAPSIRPAQSSTVMGSGMKKPESSQVPFSAPAPSVPAPAPVPHLEEAPASSAPIVQFPKPQAPVNPLNGAPASPAPAVQPPQPQAPVNPLNGSPIVSAPTGQPALPAPTQKAPSNEAPAPSTPPPAAQPTIPLAGTTITANSFSQYIVGTQTLLPGGPAVTLSGTAVSLAPSATAIIIGGSSTIAIASPPAPSAHITPAPNIGATPTNIPLVVINGQTLTAGGGATAAHTITIESIPVHVSGSYVIYGTSTIPISAVATAIPKASIYTTHAPAIVIGSQTLVPGGSALTFGIGSGSTRILALESGGSSVIVVSAGQGRTSTTIEGLSGFVTQGLDGKQGASGSGNGTVTASRTPSLQMYTGAAVSSRCGESWSWFVGIAAMVAGCGVLG